MKFLYVFPILFLPRRSYYSYVFKLGIVAHTYNSSKQEAEVGESQIWGQPEPYSGSLSQQNKQKDWGCSWLVECLPRTWRSSLGFALSTVKRKKG